MTAVITQNRLKKALVRKVKKLVSMTDAQLRELDKKILLSIQLYLMPQVLHGLIDNNTIADVWLRLE